jgi:PAS domain S-box-containing protein
MEWQITSYTLPLALAVVIATAGTAAAWHQRESRMDTWGTLVQVSVALWSLCTLLTVSATTLGWKRLWFALFLSTIPLLVVTTCLFLVHFVGQTEWLTQPRVAALLAFPAVTLVASLTNGSHGLLLVDVGLERTGSVVRLVYEWGIGTYAVAATAYLLVAGYNLLLVRQVLRSRNVYRKLSVLFLLANGVVALVTVLSLTRLSPFPHFMLVPFTYLLVGVALIVGTWSVTLVRAVPMDRLLAVIGSHFDSTVPLARDFVLEAVDNGILVLDGSERIVDANSTGTRMLGLDRPIGKQFTSVVRPELVLDSGSVDPILHGEQPVRELEDEVWVRSPDGERCYEIRISALADGDDASAHVVLLHDVTDRKRREERLKAQKSELQSQKQQLEHQNERLDRFAGIVSHDLRNPLNVASGYLELIDARLDDDGGATVSPDELERMTQATDRMGAIVDDALTLAREGKAVTETDAVDLAEVARTAWKTAETAEAELTVETNTTVEADPGRLRTVFENLYRNSVEHGREDVTVTVGEVDRPGTTGFYVADDGPGIPDDRKEMVLEHGYTTQENGTGLGLSIVTDVDSAHGWDVGVTDSESEGTRFEFTGHGDGNPAIDGLLDEASEPPSRLGADSRPAEDG